MKRWLLACAVVVAPVEAAAQGGVDVEFAKQGRLAPADTVAEGGKRLASMQAALARVTALRRKARDEKDVVKLVCLDDKRAQLEAAVRAAGERYESLRRAVLRGDDALRLHEYTLVVLLAERAAGLARSADACVGELPAFLVDEGARWSVDPSIPGDDPTEAPLPSIDVVPRPTEASPTS